MTLLGYLGCFCLPVSVGLKGSLARTMLPIKLCYCKGIVPRAMWVGLGLCPTLAGRGIQVPRQIYMAWNAHVLCLTMVVWFL
jgi:hypothetical protein